MLKPSNWVQWAQISAAALPGIAAVIALIFAWQSVTATNHQLKVTQQQLMINQQSQITDRYNAAITNLGSHSVDVRLGGIYALQRIMQDSPRDQPTIVAVLCSFVRDQADQATIKKIPVHPATDVQAALTVVGVRNIAHDGSTTVVDFNGTQLTGADLHDANLTGAEFIGTDFTDANLAGARLDDADLIGAHLGDASLFGARLGDAKLIGAYLGGTEFIGAYLVNANLSRTYLVKANFTHANRTGAKFTGAVGRRRAKGL